MCIEQCPKYVQNTISYIADRIEPEIDKVKNFCKKAVLVFDNMSLEVKQWSDANLPKPISEIAYRAFRGLPIALAYLFAPTPVVLVAIFGYCISSFVRPIPMNTHNYIRNGLAIGVGLEALQDAVIFAVTGNPVAFIAATINALCAGFLYTNSRVA